MFKKYFVGSLLFCLPLTAFAIPKEKNVTITSATDYYEFVFNNKTNKVEVKETLTTNYYCNTYREEIPISDIYTDNVSIDDVSTRIDGKKISDFKPKYTYYKTDDYFFSDERLCYFTLPMSKKGSTGTVIFEKTINDPKYFTSIFFSEPYKVISKEVIIKIPRWMKVEIKDMNFADNSITMSKKYDERSDADVITYTVSNLNYRAEEDNSPGPSYNYPHLFILTKSSSFKGNEAVYFNTLKDQYDWYREITKDMGNDKAVLKAKALDITKNCTNDMDKIKAVLYWVQGNIRYLAFEDGIAGFRPEKANEVLRKNYGDCKGMANLTKELLSALGYDSRLCWIGTNHIAYDYTTPSLAVDNHMICALMYQGKTYFLDGTESYLGFNEYAERIQGRQVLIENGQQYILTRIPSTTVDQNLDYEKRELTINGNDLQGKSDRVWRGEEKEYILANLNDIKKDRSADAFTKYLANNNNDYVVSGVTTSDMGNYDHDIKAQYSLVHKNAVSHFNKDYYVDLDFRKEFNGYSIDTAERNNDFWFSYKHNVLSETRLTLPDGYKVTSMPAGLLIQNADYEISLKYTLQANNLLYTKSIHLKNPHLKKKQFGEWNKDIAKLTQTYNQQVVLTAN